MAQSLPPKMNPQTPIPARPVVNFPTPVIADKILNEYINTTQGSYQPLDYGTPFDAVVHNAFQGSYPNHVLVYQSPVDLDGYVVRRVWASNRVDQDSYNYSITYAESDPDFPTYTRTYVYPREGYVPLEPLSPDPEDPGALLVSEVMINETEPPELSSQYIKVVRVYETLPGPIVETEDQDTELNQLVFTRRQVILSDDTFMPDYWPLLLEMRESPRTKYTKLRIISYLNELPADKTEFMTGTYQFPSLVFGISLSVVELTPSPNRSEVIWYPSMRAAPDVQANLKTITSFHVGEPPDETLFVIPVRNLIYRGISYQIAINNVLSDGIPLTATFVGDDRYGDLVESITFAPTSLSATEYEALIGTFQTVGCNIQRWRNQIYVKTITQVELI